MSEQGGDELRCAGRTQGKRPGHRLLGADSNQQDHAGQAEQAGRQDSPAVPVGAPGVHQQHGEGSRPHAAEGEQGGETGGLR